MEIVSASINDLDEICTLLRECASYMRQKKIFQWNENYPTVSIIEADIEAKNLWKMTSKDKIIGVVVFYDCMDDYYKDIQWLYEGNAHLYVHRLAVRPDYQAQGIGQKLMHFTENHATTQGYTSIRLDTFSKNERNQRFYETQGYQKLKDVVFFPKQSEFPFYCYEKKMS